jgi:hypothetical protein
VNNKTLLAGVALVLSATGAYGQQRPQLEVAVEFIIGNCYRTVDDISRVNSAATLFKWKPLSPDMSNIGKPVDAKDYAAWQVEYEKEIFLVAVNRGVFRDRPAEICSVVANVAPGDLLPRLMSALKLRLLHSDSDSVQINEFYELQHPTQNQAFMSVVKSVDGRAPTNITFIGLR